MGESARFFLRGCHRDPARGDGSTVGRGGDEAADDAADAAALFDVLEREVVPAYYERDERGLPSRWLELMRGSIELLGARFNTNRMVREYVETMYLPAHRARRKPAEALA